MQITSQKFKTGKIFVMLQYSRSLLNNKTNGRSDVFFWQTSYHPPMFLFLDMEEYIIISSPTENCKQYEVTIGNFPACTCIDFVLMMIRSLGRYGKWVVNTYITSCNM
jgi:hypothetical protein